MWGILGASSLSLKLHWHLCLVFILWWGSLVGARRNTQSNIGALHRAKATLKISILWWLIGWTMKIFYFSIDYGIHDAKPVVIATIVKSSRAHDSKINIFHLGKVRVAVEKQFPSHLMTINIFMVFTPRFMGRECNKSDYFSMFHYCSDFQVHSTHKLSLQRHLGRKTF